MEASIANLGSQGIRFGEGNAIVGQMPQLIETETVEGDPTSVRHTIDMNPTIISRAQLASLLTDHLGPIVFLGHVVVK